MLIYVISNAYKSHIRILVSPQQTRESWQTVFFIAAGMYVFGAAMYCVLAAGHLQPWAKDPITLHDVTEVDKDTNIDKVDCDESRGI